MGVRRALAAAALAGMAVSAAGQSPAGYAALFSLLGESSGGNATRAMNATVSPEQVAFGMGCMVTGLNMLTTLPSHLVTGEAMRLLQRHESLLGEHLSIRGPLHFIGFARTAVPEIKGFPTAWNDTAASWSAAGLSGSNMRLLWESAETLYVFPQGCGYPIYHEYIKKTLVSLVRDGGYRELFVFNRFAVPVAEIMDSSETVEAFHRMIGWGVGADGLTYAVPEGFSIVEGHAWFQTRFHATALMMEGYRAYALGADYTAANAAGAALNIYLAPQVGAFGVATTQLIPIIGRINRVAHGGAGPQWTRSMVHHGGWPTRLLTYGAMTGMYTWPQYDIVFSLMANVPNGAGVMESGFMKCMNDLGRPCLAGPTMTLYESTEGSPWAFLPVGIAVGVQAATLAYLYLQLRELAAPVQWHGVQP